MHRRALLPEALKSQPRDPQNGGSKTHIRYNQTHKLLQYASMLFEQIKNYLIETAGVDARKFDNPDLKVADLELDSLGLIEMLFEVEDKYGFQIPDPMVFLPMTFAEMVAAIDVMVQEHTKAQAAKH